MILNENKTFLAYRCPRCGSGVIGIAGSFALSGGRLLKLKCPCGGSELTVTETTDKNLRVSVPCMLCNGEHTYLVSPTLFYGRDLFLLACSYSGLDICFIGEEERVSEALKRTKKPCVRCLQMRVLPRLPICTEMGMPPCFPTPKCLKSSVSSSMTWKMKERLTAPATTANTN